MPIHRHLFFSINVAALLCCGEANNIERQRKKCERSSAFKPVRVPNDLNATFLPLLNEGAFAELSPKVLSTDPWVIYFETFMSEAEVSAIEAHMFKGDFMPSPAGGGSAKHHARHSETAFCIGQCDEHATVQAVRKRASSITGVPPDNFDFSQALRYKEGMFYKTHHDNHPTFHYLPSGSRIFTYFVYLSDEGLEGGATYFPRLGLTAPAKRGAAVLFVNTRDDSPQTTDIRSEHESLPVTKGQKRGMNMWLYQYDYRHFWQQGCTTIELADQLGEYGKAAVEVQPKVIFFNHAKKAVLHIFSIEDRRAERYVGKIEPGSNFTVAAVDGQLLAVRNAASGKKAKTLKEYYVRPNAVQRVNLGKKQKEEL
eukprot:TRINITY_DN63758_c0_g1_i1.p1 TRINITY_DN63758_c0_g1~~TRINITY_DN63758_c0_g1_i1.p1  ORF type:complete len:369 (-),score=94.67 TRINITY_DN63758_c0_g1_i1:289-1395(-)